MRKFITGFTLALLTTGFIYFFWLRDPSHQTPSHQTHTYQENHAQIIFTFSKKLGHHNTDPLTPDELEQFKQSVQYLSYDEVIKSIDLIEPPAGESCFTPGITPGEPRDNTPKSWEPPTELLASRLIELAPVHTSRWLQYSHITPGLGWGLHWRGGVSFIKRFGQTHPELAWRETQLHYEKFWDIFDEEHQQNIPQMASGTFYSITLRDPQLARQFILEESYQSKPYARTIHRDALSGMLRAIKDDPDALIDFLNWKTNAGLDLDNKLKSHSYRIRLSHLNNVESMALALVAKQDPPRAIKWAKANDSYLMLGWQFAVYAGWIKYWPYTQESMSTYLTRYENAMQWLVDNTQHPSEYTLIHNAYCQWNDHDRQATIEWLNNNHGSTKLKQIKTELKQHHYIQEISAPQNPKE